MEDFLSKNSKLLAFSLVGLSLIGFGVLCFKIDMFSSGDKVEVLSSTKDSQNTQQDIVVEISGAVEKAGVYKLPNGSRVNDLIIVAGGISADANREWIDKNINKASKLSDGQKLYIYHSDEISAKSDGGIKLDHQVLGSSNQINDNLVNINTASQSILEKLNGIGPVYATNIIEHRPYSNVEELVSKGAITKKVLEKIKNDITP